MVSTVIVRSIHTVQKREQHRRGAKELTEFKRKVNSSDCPAFFIRPDY